MGYYRNRDDHVTHNKTRHTHPPAGIHVEAGVEEAAVSQRLVRVVLYYLTEVQLATRDDSSGLWRWRYGGAGVTVVPGSATAYTAPPLDTLFRCAAGAELAHLRTCAH